MAIEMSIDNNPRNVKVAVLCACAVSIMAGGCRDRSAADHVRRGDELVAGKHLPEAILEYRVALQKDAKQGQVYVKLAEACLAIDDLNCVRAAYIRAADLF